MRIGCPKEIKDNENRVGLTPNATQAYVAAGHSVCVEKGAGRGSAIGDQEYIAAGAEILPTAEAVWASADISVLVDVAIDQGGCCETSHATKHSDPVYVVDGGVHYCVANMPGAYARTSTFALNNATVHYGLKLAAHGAEKACRENPGLKNGLNMYKGAITCKPVAEAFGILNAYSPADAVIN
jgi:alanine dehydrogenase